MTHAIIYPQGGSNKFWEPMHIQVSGLETALTIRGLTYAVMAARSSSWTATARTSPIMITTTNF